MFNENNSTLKYVHSYSFNYFEYLLLQLSNYDIR
jgi:hypothetical protein